MENTNTQKPTFGQKAARYIKTMTKEKFVTHLMLAMIVFMGVYLVGFTLAEGRMDPELMATLQEIEEKKVVYQDLQADLTQLQKEFLVIEAERDHLNGLLEGISQEGGNIRGEMETIEKDIDALLEKAGGLSGRTLE